MKDHKANKILTRGKAEEWKNVNKIEYKKYSRMFFENFRTIQNTNSKSHFFPSKIIILISKSSMFDT